MIRVIIVDDQVLLRESIAYILNSDEEIEVVAEASNGLEAIELCKIYKPDIVLMDIEMPVMNGIEATEKIKEMFDDIFVIILTTFENPDNIEEALMVGAEGYVVKTIRQKDLVQSVKCVSGGLTVIHESVRQILIDRLIGKKQSQSPILELLSEKELKIVKLIAMGETNKAIGKTLNYSEGTIKNNVTKILDKLGVDDRMHVAIFAMENHLV